MNPLSRRTFLGAAATAGAGAVFSRSAIADATAQTAEPAKTLSTKTPPVCIFTKHLHFIKDYKELAKAAKALGVDGLDLTVRKDGHVEPANVATDLPRALDAARAEGLSVFMVTTYLKDGNDPDAKPILENASKLGIKYVRIGNHTYAETGSILDQLDTFTNESAALAKQLDASGMTGGYHNHSGNNNVGAALWDLQRMIEKVNRPSFGSNFDTGHATVEGGLGAWRINARLLAPHVKMMSVKDFVWENKQMNWVPLGQGQVQTVEFLKLFREAGFSGPVSMHFEYKVPSNDAMLEEIRTAAVTLRGQLKQAGYV